MVFEPVKDRSSRGAHGAAAMVVEGVDLEHLPRFEIEGVLIEEDLVLDDHRVHQLSAMVCLAGVGVVFPALLAPGGVKRVGVIVLFLVGSGHQESVSMMGHIGRVFTI